LSIAFPALDFSAWLMLLPSLPCLDACANAAVAGDLVDGLFDASTSSASAAFLGVVWPTLRGFDVIDDIPSSKNSQEFSPGRLRAFPTRRTASHRQTAIRHRTCGAPHAHSLGGAELRSYRGGHFLFYLNWLVRGRFLAKGDLPDGFFTSTNLKGGESIGTISVPTRPYLEDQYLVF
jgi:hypothetical protein